ncbi:UDP-N-acetylmuramoyl-L-alanyl-D-glutamate--2,6-diaminopimelate ligase [soil metagenome]
MKPVASASSPQSLEDINGWLLQALAGTPAAQLTSDSRSVMPGDVFFAYAGDAGDGRKYIADAIERGAQAVIFDADGFQWNDDWDASRTVSNLAVAGLRDLAGPIASLYYASPDSIMYSIGVTGTNGKTSCTQWLGHALSARSSPTAVIGTLGVGIFRLGKCDDFSVTGYTTPDAVLLQRKLAQARGAGATALAIEASSIGLDHGRLNGMHFDAALFTNLTRDHLDHHGSMAAYEAAKTKLFDWPGLRHAVINLDDAMGERLIARLKSNANGPALIGYTLDAASTTQVPALEGVAVLRASALQASALGTSFHVDSPFGSGQVKTQLLGRFNVSNVLGVLGVLLAKGIDWQSAIDAIESLRAVPGRMQQLGGHDAPLVVIDYAHTPDALDKTLESLRPVARQRGGKLWCVFGCGGDRDPGKRPLMGSSALAADHVVVTSDNPRSESPAAIMAQIVSGIDASDKQAMQMIEDRAAAILYAVKHAARSDVILLAGKGHESTQEVMGRKQPFLDADHATLALSARATRMGGA